MTPQEVALNAISLFLNEEGFATGWLNTNPGDEDTRHNAYQNVLMVQSNVSAARGIPVTFRICFRGDGELNMARTVLIHKGEKISFCNDLWEFKSLDLADPRLFDQLVETLEYVYD